MDTAAILPTRSNHAPLASALSLLAPGAGQFFIKQRMRGAAILLTTLAVAYLIYWADDNFRIGQTVLAGVTTNWLWLALACFWLWNIFDAYRHARGLLSYSVIGFLIPLFIVYAIGWQVTDAKLERLVTRASDAQTVFTAILHPDLFTTDDQGNVKPSENFGDIIGKIVDGPAPAILVQTGVVRADSTFPNLVTGKLIETIALGLMATIFSVVFAVPLSFFAAHNITSRMPGGTIIYYAMRTFLNIVRAIDTVIWGLVIIVWVGLGPFAGMIALLIHSTAALGKLYSEEVEHIDAGPIEAVTASGANLLQVIRYAVVPQIVPPFLAYTLLRWDINMRSATIVGFVAGGGIGFFVLETIRKGGYEQYAAALWAVAIVIISVDYVSAKWRERILIGDTQVKLITPQPFYKSPRQILYLVFGLLVFVVGWNLTQIDLKKLLDPGPTFGRLVSDFVSIDLTPSLVETVWKQMLLTIFQALIATTLGGLMAIPFSFLAARNLTGRSVLSIWIYYITRGLFNILRSIEALLYVAIFVFWVGIGPFAGALALAVTTFALIGKLFSEAIENIDAGPMEAITATGANTLQTIAYAILPQIIPPFVSYAIYQWDINVRIATIVGFAGGGGIGLLLLQYSGQLQYHKVGTVVAMIVVTVALMDFASAKIRERMV